MGRVWRYSLVTRIGIGVAAAVVFGLGAIVLDLPIAPAGRDAGTVAAVAVAGALLFGLGIFVCFGLTAVVRTRIAVGPNGLDAVVPSGHDRLLAPRFRTIRVALRDIRTVERRTEIGSRFGVTSAREALSITTAPGVRIGLVTDAAGSIGLPVDDIAAGIAAAAGTVVTGDGTVRSRALGLYASASSARSDTPLDAADAARFGTIARTTSQIATGLLLFVFLLRAFL